MKTCYACYTLGLEKKSKTPVCVNVECENRVDTFVNGKYVKHYPTRYKELRAKREAREQQQGQEGGGRNGELEKEERYGQLSLPMKQGHWQKSQSEWNRQKEAPWLCIKANCQNWRYIDPNRRWGDRANRTCYAYHKASLGGQLEANEEQANEGTRLCKPQKCPQTQYGSSEAGTQFMKEVGRYLKLNVPLLVPILPSKTLSHEKWKFLVENFTSKDVDPSL